MKTCKKCKKPSAFYEKSREGQLGYDWCKDCVREEYALQAGEARRQRASGTDNGIIICPSCMDFKPEKDFYPSELANSRIGFKYACRVCSVQLKEFYSARAKAAKRFA